MRENSKEKLNKLCNNLNIAEKKQQKKLLVVPCPVSYNGRRSFKLLCLYEGDNH